MASTLKVDSILFADSTSLSSYYNVLPQSTKMLFHVSSAPTGWTQDTSFTDQTLLRVVTGTGASGSTSGLSFSQALATNIDISSTLPVTINNLASGGTTLTESQIPSHTHPSIFSSQISAPSRAYSGSGSGFQSILMGSAGTVNPRKGTTNPPFTQGPWSQGLIGNAGGSGSHNHTVSYTSNASVPGTVSFSLKYIDVTVCSRN